ncbi:hypothetical protein [Sporomusa ovata]|nr:hypothetical protein [Sporomusa ovata]
MFWMLFYAWTNEANPNKDSWIEIDKPDIIPAPLVPPEVQPWVISGQISDSSIECPKYCLDPKVEPVGVEEHNINSLRLLADSANRSQVNPPHPFDSWFELDIFLEIVSRGYRVIPQHEVAGYR